MKHAQGPDITSLYPANIGRGGSWVRGKRSWSSGGERGKPILGFLHRLFWGKCHVGMTYRPKEVRMSWNHYVHAIRDRERASTPQQVRVPRQANKQNSLLCLVIRSGTASTRGGVRGGREGALAPPDQIGRAHV